VGVDEQRGAIGGRNGVDAGGVDAMWEFVAVDDQLGAVLPAIVLSSSQGMFYLRWSLCPRFDTLGASIAHVLVVPVVSCSGCSGIVVGNVWKLNAHAREARCVFILVGPVRLHMRIHRILHQPTK
jgi:hypothetical protein